MAKLTEKQKRFIDEYVIDFNATQAAIKAGYSQRTACEQASRMLRNVNVQVALKEKARELAGKAGITQEQVLAEYKKIAFEVQILEYKGGDQLKALEFLSKLLNIGGQMDEQTINVTIDYTE